jgi:glucose/arabinose dehydrogenase
MARVVEFLGRGVARARSQLASPGAKWCTIAAALAIAAAGCRGANGVEGKRPIERIARAEASSAPKDGAPRRRCRGIALPADAHYVPEGLCARAVATRQGRLRQITFAKNGDLFGVTTDGRILRYRDADGDGMYRGGEIVDWAHTGGDNGNNAHLDEAAGLLYAGSPEGVKRWRYAPDVDQGGEGEHVMIGQPGGGNHPLHPVHVWDGWMYVDSGSDGNAMDPMPADYDTDRSVVKRFELGKLETGKPFHWDDGEVVARGVRNVTGFARDGSGRIYGVVNGGDDLRYRGEDVHADNPGEDIVRIEPGAAHGFPFCFTAVRVAAGGQVVPPGTRLAAEWASQLVIAGSTKSNRDDAWCRTTTTPAVTTLQAHSAPLDIVFFTGPDRGALPARWVGGAFVSLHGSWNRKPSTGYKIVWVPFDADGNAPMPKSTASETTFPYEVVLGGGRAGAHADGAWGWEVGDEGEDVVRPVGVAISPVDGALYVSSDNRKVSFTGMGEGDGALYRIELE